MNIKMVNYKTKNITADVHNIIMHFSHAGLPVARGITDTEDVNTYTEFLVLLRNEYPMLSLLR